MEIMIANKLTGEVVAAYCKDGIRAIRGYIRQWMKDGLQLEDFDILKFSSNSMFYHIRSYAWSKVITTCDVCNKYYKREEMELVCDSEDVCLVVLCGNCTLPL